MPQDILDWRAAEYGIDPTDTDTLLEIVLHELHMPVTEETDGQPARYAGDGPVLKEATSTAAARAAHLDRVKNCPVRIAVRDRAALNPIRARRPDPARIRAMREAVDTSRWTALYGALPVQPIVKEASRV
ncbi:hypothetical protein [Streptomyces turgidiscabies]|uniref:hypothetical protein n=1 Tax=Streptomyces turgidiscabies TaxID=85558 RepID=UPI0038F6EB95